MDIASFDVMNPENWVLLASYLAVNFGRAGMKLNPDAKLTKVLDVFLANMGTAKNK